MLEMVMPPFDIRPFFYPLLHDSSEQDSTLHAKDSAILDSFSIHRFMMNPCPRLLYYPNPPMYSSNPRAPTLGRLKSPGLFPALSHVT